jgi:hypothetical protein
MFVRIKKIGKYRYGYLVENKWTEEGARQKNRAYLGRVFDFGRLDLNALFDEDLSGELTEKEFKKGLELLLQRLLYHLGFDKKGSRFVKEGFKVSKKEVRKGKKKCVIEVHHGFLCDHTLAELFSLAYKGGSLREWGFRLANTISMSGIPISKQEFVGLSARAISEHEIRVRNKEFEDFYY